MKRLEFIVLILFFCSYWTLAQDKPTATKLTAHQALLSFDSIQVPDSVTLTLKNNLAASKLKVDILLRANTGEQITTTVTLEPRQVRDFKIPELFSGIFYPSSSISLSYQSPDAENLTAALSIDDLTKKSHEIARIIENSDDAQVSGWEVLWYRSPNATESFLTLTNPSNMGSLAKIDGSKEIFVGPGTTVKVPVTQKEGSRHGGTSVLASRDVVVGSQGVGVVGTPYRLSMTNRGAPARPSRPITFRSGPVLFDNGEESGVILYNRSAQQLPVTVKLVSYGIGNKGQLASQGIVAVPPSETIFVPLGSNTREMGGWEAVNVEYNGDGSELLTMLVSSLRSRVHAQPLSPYSSRLFVGTKWVFSSTGSTVIRVANGGRVPSKFVLTLYSKDGSPLYELLTNKLKPGEDQLVDLSAAELRTKPDSKGKLLSAQTTEGTYEVSPSEQDTSAVLFSASATPVLANFGGEDMCCGQ